MFLPGKEKLSGNPERAESHRARGQKEERPVKKGKINQIRCLSLLRIQISAEATFLWCLFFRQNHPSEIIQTCIFPFGVHWMGNPPLPLLSQPIEIGTTEFTSIVAHTFKSVFLMWVLNSHRECL